MRSTEHILSEILEVLKKFFRFIEEFIETLNGKPGAAVQIKVVLGGTNNMNVTLGVGQKVPFFITGTDANGVRTGTLLTGATLAVTISDTTKVSIVADPTPLTAPDGGPSIASGTATAIAVGTVTLTATVTNADGTAGPIASGTVAVTAAAPGPATGIGVAFGGVR